MKRIALISDNHSYVDPQMIKYLEEVDEIWHAGDIGDLKSLDALIAMKPFRAVYGNIDGSETRAIYPLNDIWECEGVKVLMTHIGGYPGRYKSRVLNLIKTHLPDLYICGHSHICKVQYDPEYKVLHMNPGAYGNHGWHQVRTMLRFTCEEGKVKDAEVIELGYRGSKRK